LAAGRTTSAARVPHGTKAIVRKGDLMPVSGKIPAAVLAMLALAGCATNGQRELEQVDNRGANAGNRLSQGNVQMNLRIGETRKADVLDVFGAPNITTRDSTGGELWSYQRYARVTQIGTRANGWTVMLGGGASDQSTVSETTRTMTLIIRFDSNDIVSDFRSRTSEF
jgi:outer membrane protein assembly factor BamE (lipoprotein component of BamABCDE complex)